MEGSEEDPERRDCRRPEVDGSGKVIGVVVGVGVRDRKNDVVVCFPVVCCNSIMHRRLS